MDQRKTSLRRQRENAEVWLTIKQDKQLTDERNAKSKLSEELTEILTREGYEGLIVTPRVEYKKNLPPRYQMPQAYALVSLGKSECRIYPSQRDGIKTTIWKLQIWKSGESSDTVEPRRGQYEIVASTTDASLQLRMWPDAKPKMEYEVPSEDLLHELVILCNENGV